MYYKHVLRLDYCMSKVVQIYVGEFLCERLSNIYTHAHKTFTLSTIVSAYVGKGFVPSATIV